MINAGKRVIPAIDWNEINETIAKNIAAEMNIILDETDYHASMMHEHRGKIKNDQKCVYFYKGKNNLKDYFYRIYPHKRNKNEIVDVNISHILYDKLTAYCNMPECGPVSMKKGVDVLPNLTKLKSIDYRLAIEILLIIVDHHLA